MAGSEALLDVLLGVRSVLPEQPAGPAAQAWAQAQATAAVYHKPHVRSRAGGRDGASRWSRPPAARSTASRCNEGKLNG